MSKSGKRILIVLGIIAALFVAGSIASNANHRNPETASSPSAGIVLPSGDLKVHFIDVGQGDSILIQTPSGKNMLVDAGTGSTETELTAYLKANGVSVIDALVATHPHEDHIGGMDVVVRQFRILSVYMPKVSYTTKAYENLLTAISAKGLKVTTAKRGVLIEIDSDVRIEMLSPGQSAYDEINDYSPVIRITYGGNSFLLCGDAETAVENEILAAGLDVKADVIKVGHHGSNSSSSKAFVTAVAPRYAVISVGAGNTYGHPTQETLDRYASIGARILRTDLDGTILVTADGTDLSVLTSK